MLKKLHFQKKILSKMDLHCFRQKYKNEIHKISLPMKMLSMSITSAAEVISFKKIITNSSIYFEYLKHLRVSFITRYILILC